MIPPGSRCWRVYFLCCFCFFGLFGPRRMRCFSGRFDAGGRERESDFLPVLPSALRPSRRTLSCKCDLRVPGGAQYRRLKSSQELCCKKKLSSILKARSLLPPSPQRTTQLRRYGAYHANGEKMAGRPRPARVRDRVCAAPHFGSEPAFGNRVFRAVDILLDSMSE